MNNLIGYYWKEASNCEKIGVINPATMEVIDTVPQVTVEDINEAVEVAAKEQKKWAMIPMYEKAKIMRKFSDIVESRKEELAKLLCSETGKPITEALAEISNARTFAEGYAEKAKHMYGSTMPWGSEPGHERTAQIVEREPLGVIAAIIPFNFPCDLFGQKVPPALLMGNSVIVKPSTCNPLTIIEYVKIMTEAGVPAGAIQVLTGRGEIVGEALARHPKVNGITLTGSTETGIKTIENSANNLTRLFLELGGNDAFILLEDGDIQLAVEETIVGRMYNGGQICCASKRFLVHNSVKAEYIERLKERLSLIRVGDPLDHETEMGPLIDLNAALKVENEVNNMVSLGAKIVCGGKRKDAYYYPTILTDVTRDMPVASDLEIFGPVVSVIGFDTVDEAIEIANQSKYGLSGCVFTEDYRKACEVSARLECGQVVINGASFYRPAEIPFNGWKHSGLGGCEGIMTTLEEMSRVKNIILKNVMRIDVNKK